MSRHIAVWLDHHEAKVFHVTPDSFEEVHLQKPHASFTQKHRDKTHPAEMKAFFEDIVGAVQSAEEILVLGPGSAKLELIKWVHEHHKRLVSKIIGVETADHPHDRQIVAHARATFDKYDRLQGNVA